MAWPFWAYVGSNVGIAAAIIAVIGGFLGFLIYKYDNIFYKLIKIMFHIKLKYSDKQQDGDGEKKNTSTQTNEKTTVIAITPTKEAFVNPPKSPTTMTPAPPSKKTKLNLYGKTIDAEKKRNKFMLSVIIVAVIGAACIAGVQGCLLANITVYPNGPCPSYGVMDCYGKNDTYFNCTPGTQTDATLFTDSATCFRWIAHDTTINDVMTQLGVCTGLLHAFCAIVQLILRFLLYAFSKHPQTQAEAQAVAALSINETANTTEEKEDSNKTQYTYEHPVYLAISLLALLLIPVGAILTAILLGVFRISITALTYVVLIAIVIVSLFAILWIVMEEEDEDKSTSPIPALTTITRSDADDFQPADLSPIVDAIFNHKS